MSIIQFNSNKDKTNEYLFDGLCDSPDNDEYLKETDIADFHLITLLSGKVKALACKKCGCTEFNVGVDTVCTNYTALKCPVCKWELLIHEG